MAAKSIERPASTGATWVVTVPTVTVIGVWSCAFSPRVRVLAAASRSRPPMSMPATLVPRGTLPVAPAYAVTQPPQHITSTITRMSRTALPPSAS